MVKVKASQALVQELAQWGIQNVYGIPADSLIDGFAAEQEHVRYIQVRHEEVAALAASASAKLTGQISVAMASVGPGATHLLNGLYDALMDHVPMLAIVSQVPTAMIGTHYLQDMDENELFASLDTYHVQVADAQQIPATIHQAIAAAYATHSPSVVIIPDDLATQEIDYDPVKPVSPKTEIMTGTIEELTQTRSLIGAAKRPLLFVGRGGANARDEVVAFSKQYAIPVVSSALGVPSVPSDFNNYLGPVGRIGTAAAYEALNMADLIIMVGTQYPFARYYLQDVATIQVNHQAGDLGNQVPATQRVLADGKAYLKQLVDLQTTALPIRPFLKAARLAKQDWDRYLAKRAASTTPKLTPEAVLDGVNAISEADAVYGLDVGNNTVCSLRQLRFDQQQTMTMSAWFGTMGYGLAAGIAAQMADPKRQVITVSGDGGFSMVVQDLLTQVQYGLPILNVILENGGYGFIQQEKKAAGEGDYALRFNNANWAGVASNMGAVGLRVTTAGELKEALNQYRDMCANNDPRPVVLEAVISDALPLDTSNMTLDVSRFSAAAISTYRAEAQLTEAAYPSLAQHLKDLTQS